MPKGSEELTKERENEIIDACKKLYRTKSFKEITIKEIGKTTSFTRTSIYNYFQTKGVHLLYSYTDSGSAQKRRQSLRFS